MAIYHWLKRSLNWFKVTFRGDVCLSWRTPWFPANLPGNVENSPSNNWVWTTMGKNKTSWFNHETLGSNPVYIIIRLTCASKRSILSWAHWSGFGAINWINIKRCAMKIIGNSQCNVNVFHHSLGDPSKFYDVNWESRILLAMVDELGAIASNVTPATINIPHVFSFDWSHVGLP
jgi:hypothetical protein